MLPCRAVIKTFYMKVLSNKIIVSKLGCLYPSYEYGSG